MHLKEELWKVNQIQKEGNISFHSSIIKYSIYIVIGIYFNYRIHFIRNCFFDINYFVVNNKLAWATGGLFILTWKQIKQIISCINIIYNEYNDDNE